MEELVEICRVDSQEYWREVSNPNFKSVSQEGLAAQLMLNIANEYVEYKNCGVVYRVIRKKDLFSYIPE